MSRPTSAGWADCGPVAATGSTGPASAMPMPTTSTPGDAPVMRASNAASRRIAAGSPRDGCVGDGVAHEDAALGRDEGAAHPGPADVHREHGPLVCHARRLHSGGSTIRTNGGSSYRRSG